MVNTVIFALAKQLWFRKFLGAHSLSFASALPAARNCSMVTLNKAPLNHHPIIITSARKPKI